MIASPTHINDRVILTRKTLEQFKDREFRWGACDCARIAAWHLRQFGRNAHISRGGSYKTALGARAALKKYGHDSLADALDSLHLPRIAPAEAWVGDFVMGESPDAFGALGIYLGNGAMLGFHEDVSTAAVLRRVHLDHAWRVMPL